MREQNISSEIVAHWRYAPDEWRDFVEDEKKSPGREIRQTLPGYFLYAVVIISLIALVARWADGLAAAGLVLLLIPAAGLFLLFATGVHLLIKQNEQAKLEAKAGDVQITIFGVNTNGMMFDWSYREKSWRLQSVKRLKRFAANGAELEILEFTCTGEVRHPKGGFMTVDKKWRVPVPRGKEREADFVIQRLKEREADFVIQRLYEVRAAFSQIADELSTKPLGLAAQIGVDEHDFTGATVCNKCGSSIEAVMHFKWKCKK